MSNTVGYLIFKLLPAIAALLYTMFLLSVRSNSARHKAIMRKHKKGTPGYDLYSKVYSSQFLVAWVFITLWLIIGLAFDLYRSTHTPSLFVLYFVLIVSISISLAAAYLLSALFKSTSRH